MKDLKETKRPSERADKSNLTDLPVIFEKVHVRDTYRLSYVANKLVLPVYEEIKKEFDLNRGEYLLLLCLSHFEKLTAQDVANMTGQPRNSISRSVHRALAKDYLERTADPEDGRQAWLRLKPKGRAMQKKVGGKFSVKEAALFGVLDEAERVVLDQILDKLSRQASLLP